MLTNQPVDEDPHTESEDDYEENTGQVDGGYTPAEQQVKAGRHITPPQRAIGSDGKGKRDANARGRVIKCLQKYGLETHACSLTNDTTDAVQIEYAHLLPLATSQETVGFLKISMAVQFDPLNAR